MDVRYVDAHCHIQFDQFSADQSELITTMQRQGIASIVVGCDRVSSTQAVVLSDVYEHVYAAVGLHPTNEPDERFDSHSYRELAQHSRVVALGECGLDYYRPSEVTEEVKLAQKELFMRHVELAAELDKPLIVHTRPAKGSMNAYWDVIDILKNVKTQNPHVRGDIHFFVGGIAEADAFIALGFTLSFTAVITFARDYDEVIRHVPLSSILSETDAPYVAPLVRRGQRNDPLAVVDVVQKIAEIRGENLEHVRSVLVANATRVFNLSN